MKAIDYSLYLVTDSTQPILAGRDLGEVVAAAIAGGKPSGPLPLYASL